MFIVRQSSHINQDIQRNWSSWNFGQEGIFATADQIEAWKEEAIETDQALCISGFELWGNEIKESVIRQLYPGYWVLVDTFHGAGLACNILSAQTIQQAIAQISAPGFSIEMGEGQTVDCSSARVVYSLNDIHILEV